jgi:hypothetical protein
MLAGRPTGVEQEVDWRLLEQPLFFFGKALRLVRLVLGAVVTGHALLTVIEHVVGSCDFERVHLSEGPLLR